MYCKNCGHQLPDNAAFCAECGCRTDSTAKQPEASSASGSDRSIFIVIWASIVLYTMLSTTLITRLIPDWYLGATRYIYDVLMFIDGLATILPAFAIKKKSTRIVFLILLSIYVLLISTSSIIRMFGLF